MEKHHLAYTFNLLRNIDEFNFLINYNHEEISHFRKLVTECVLATDLAKSMVWLSNARIVMLEDINVDTDNIIVMDEKKKLENKILKMQLIMKCADVGHPARLLNQHIEWSRRICEEFFCQGDMESKKGMKISPLCDRNVPPSTYPQGQIGFINYVSKPMFSLLASVVCNEAEENKPWLKYMENNIKYWEDKKKEILENNVI